MRPLLAAAFFPGEDGSLKCLTRADLRLEALNLGDGGGGLAGRVVGGNAVAAQDQIGEVGLRLSLLAGGLGGGSSEPKRTASPPPLSSCTSRRFQGE
jgi:hypothetical protein